ncbi:hypothetical protein [Qipengyuania spongiae]|uniref:Uncharacterized protein n=1 Tax=Qipengyuania spongiae TaxID=2909673 RepID=A0ABY5T1X7_9SPHN|nr:hypothetical protein [Qipengyuania spongiae]UVI39333.1 hypothetical protein L1F33_14070 [Qipengyuania spongiae]
MNAQTTIKPDEIYTFLGTIPDDEYERRAKLRSYRNAASAMLATTRCDTARQLAWTAIEWISPNLYNPCPLEWLDKLNQLAKRLMLTAMQAQEMDDLLREGEDA